MPLRESDIKLIEQALLEELSGEARTRFEERLTDHEFASAWEERRLIDTVIQEKGHAQLKHKLERLEDGIKQKTTKPKRTNWTIWFILALGIVGVLYWFIKPNAQPSTEDLYIAYYEPFPNDVDPLTKGTEDENLSAYKLYELKNYEAAITELTQLPTDNTARWFLAQAYLAMGDGIAAQPIFLEFSQSQNSEYHISAKWYLALIYINKNELEKATSLLDEVLDSDQPVYVGKTKTLLKQLKMKTN